jgi:hypothetical protein
VTQLPLVVIPTIAVPFSILLHFLSLHRLAGTVPPVALGIRKAA